MDNQGWGIHIAISGEFDTPRLAQSLGFEAMRIARSINNLWRLGCLGQEQAGPRIVDGAALRIAGPTPADNVSCRRSPLGNAILRAVQP